MAKAKQAGLKNYEKLAWDTFLRLKPHFAGPCVNATDIEYLDPPDVLCNANGRVGVEIVSWIDDTQIADAKRREKMREECCKRLNSVTQPPPANIGNAIIDFAVPEQGISTDQWPVFVSEFYDLCADVDARWCKQALGNGPQGYRCSDFVCYPTVRQYVRLISFQDQQHPSRCRACPGLPPATRVAPIPANRWWPRY